MIFRLFFKEYGSDTLVNSIPVYTHHSTTKKYDLYSGRSWKGYDLFFGAKTNEDLQQKSTVYISEAKTPKGTIIRHGTIVRLLLVLIPSKKRTRSCKWFRSIREAQKIASY